MSWKEIRKTYSLSNDALSWGRKNGKIVFRSKSTAAKLAHQSGKYDYSVYKTESFRKKQSRCGGYRKNAGRCKHIPYTKKDGTIVDLQGSWELKLAQFFDYNNVKWERNRIGFGYLFEGKHRMYFPDFKLLDFNSYVEVKGYQTEKDDAKWNQFMGKLFIVKRKEINNLDVWWKQFFNMRW